MRKIRSLDDAYIEFIDASIRLAKSDIALWNKHVQKRNANPAKNAKPQSLATINRYKKMRLDAFSASYYLDTLNIKHDEVLA